MNYHQLIRHSGIAELFHAIEISVAAAANHIPLHLHAEGLRGTGKTTALRAARAILPPIERIKGCLYNCDPQKPHCPLHHHLTAEEVAAIGTEWIPRPFLEISHSAKIASVVGSIDLGKLVDRDHSSAALLPGTIPKAHRGIIFVDEINRLADTSPELADVLLDVMGNKPGHIQIEEAGLPVVEFPVEVSIWAASNPDEEPGRLSEVRRQLSDRFDMTIAVKQPSNPSDVASILNRGAASTSAYTFFLPQTPFKDITINQNSRDILAAIYVKFQLESLRSIQSIEYIALLEALFFGRKQVEIEDLITAVSPALTHRANDETIQKIVQYLTLLKNSEQLPPELSAGAISEIQKQPQGKKLTLPKLKDFLKKLGAKLPGLPGLSGRSGKNGDPSHDAAPAKSAAKRKMTAPPNQATPMVDLEQTEWLNEGKKDE